MRKFKNSDLVDVVIGSEFEETLVETAKAEAENGDAQDSQNDDDVIRRNGLFVDNFAVLFVVAKLAIETTVAPERIVDAHCVLAVEFARVALGQSFRFTVECDGSEEDFKRRSDGHRLGEESQVNDVTFR